MLSSLSGPKVPKKNLTRVLHRDHRPGMTRCAELESRGQHVHASLYFDVCP
jgi:hypothetical protein